METAAFILAIVGTVTGGGSLAWNVWSFYLSGPRVTVELEAGRMGPAGVLTYPFKANLVRFRSDEYPVALLVVTASNSGRLPIAVTKWAIHLGEATFFLPDPPNSPALPHVLGVGETASWYMPVHEVRAARAGVEAVMPAVTELRASVSLANGRRCESDAHPADAALED
jgi:hypothetical protein